MSKLSNRITGGLKRLRSAEFQALCDDFLRRSSDEYIELESLGVMPEADKTRKGTPDSWVRCIDGKYIAIQYTTEQTNMKNKIPEDIEKLSDPQHCKVFDKIKKVLVCFNTQLKPEDIESFYEVAELQGWEFYHYSHDKLTAKLKEHPLLLREYLEIETTFGPDLKVDGDRWLKKVGLQEQAEKQGDIFRWSKEENIQSCLEEGYEIEYWTDEQELKCIITSGKSVLLRKRKFSN